MVNYRFNDDNIMKNITIAIDGFSSCGKSTMAKELAKKLGYIYIDTGAMYRAVTLYTLRENLWINENTPDKAEIIKHMDMITIGLSCESGMNKIYLNGEDVSLDIRSMEVSSRVSYISEIPQVREKLTREQRLMGKNGAIVMDGRDIGTNVFPFAELKIFLTADKKVRAERRLKEFRDKGDDKITLEDVIKNIEQRDFIDSNRDVAPLRKADDAIVLDNSNLSIDEQNRILMDLYKKAVEKSV